MSTISSHRHHPHTGTAANPSLLDPDALHRLQTQGFVRLRRVVDDAELEMLSSITDGLLRDDAVAAHPRANDFKRPDPDQPVGRIEYLFDKHPRFLALAAHPAVISIFGSVYDSPFAITWEDMLIKAAHVGFFVYFHQDSLYQSRRSPVYRAGIYLDSSKPAPLKVIPGSHTLGAMHADQVQDIVSTRGHEIVTVAADPGDIVLHDTMIVHGSDLHTDSQQRRVIYFEFRTLDQLRTDSPWGEQWIAARRELLPIAVETRETFSELRTPVAADFPEFELPHVKASLQTHHPQLAHDRGLRIDHEDTENLSWHGLPVPEHAMSSQMQ